MTTTDWKKLESTYYMQVVNRLPLVLVKGQGTIVWDESGKKIFRFYIRVGCNEFRPYSSCSIKCN